MSTETAPAASPPAWANRIVDRIAITLASQPGRLDGLSDDNIALMCVADHFMGDARAVVADLIGAGLLVGPVGDQPPAETTLFWHAECTTGMSLDFKTTGEHRPDLPATVPINCPGCHGEHQAVQVTEAEHEAYRADCEGSAQCPAYYHDHGCFADLDGSQCREPEAHTHRSAMSPGMFGGRDVDGVQMQILGDDGECFAALGHLDGAAFAAAAWKTHLELLGHDSDLDPFDAGDVLHRWAALEPAFEGAPDDEWSLRWVDEKTAGAFQVTTIDVSAL